MAKRKYVKKKVVEEAPSVEEQVVEQTTEEKARDIKYLETRWCEGRREAHQIIRKDSLRNPDHLHRSIRTPDGEKGFCVLIFG